MPPVTITSVTNFDVREASVFRLLTLYRSILIELIRRGVVRTLNSPTGDLAELLVARALGGELAPNSAKSYDVNVGDGQLIQVKARIVASGSPGERQLSTIRSWGFTHLAIVLFGLDYSVMRGAPVPVETAQGLARGDRHVRGNRIMATDALMEANGVEDFTDLLSGSLRPAGCDWVWRIGVVAQIGPA